MGEGTLARLIFLVKLPIGCDCPATSHPKTARIAFTSRTRQRLRRPPFRSGPQGDPLARYGSANP